VGLTEELTPDAPQTDNHPLRIITLGNVVRAFILDQSVYAVGCVSWCLSMLRGHSSVLLKQKKEENFWVRA
jgi:hypothetical protein